MPGIAASNARATAAVLVWPDFHAPVSRTVIPVSVHVPNDTMNVSMTAFSPCCTGVLLRAVP